jgi:signal transduction histidine kinase
MALLCYALLVAAWIVDLLTPQLFVAAILLNGPIALSSLSLRRQLTTQLVVAAEIANLIAGYVNGVQAGHHWDSIAVGDRLLAAASFILVGYLSIKSQEYAREAGASIGRMRQIEIERALREATERVRGTLNVDLVQRSILRESASLLDASATILIVRNSAFELPLTIEYGRGDADISFERRGLSTELASLVARAREHGGVVRVTGNDALGRLMLDALDAREALAAPIRTTGTDTDYVLIALAGSEGDLAIDALPAMRTFAEQAGIALEQAHLFTQLGQRNDEIARQKDELANRGSVIRDIVYALAHDLRTPLAAADVTMKQALAGAYGALPERYTEILRSTVAANEEERRIVETLLLVARYESGDESNVREPVACDLLLTRAVEEMQPVAEANGVALRGEVETGTLAILGDPNEIRRAILNLIANAIPATPQHGTILVRGVRSGDSVTVVVEDDGYGVQEARRSTLFQRFGGARHGGGTGLGLYIVRRIVEKHGGTVGYAPRQPRGSVFTMTLPSIRE